MKTLCAIFAAALFSGELMHAQESTRAALSTAMEIDNVSFRGGYFYGRKAGIEQARAGLPVPTEQELRNLSHTRFATFKDQFSEVPWQGAFSEGYRNGYNWVMAGKMFPKK